MDNCDAFKAMQRQGWAHFAPLENSTMIPAAELVSFAGIHSGQKVLDVACGTGVVAVTAARAGAAVTGLDLTPELLERARYNAQLAGVKVDWHEGDVEKLPFDDAAFDAVVSQFGHIFAPRPELAVGEMLRVLKPGGTIAFSTWPPHAMIGKTFTLVAKYSPSRPADVPPPTEWGDERIIRERLGKNVRDIAMRRGTMISAALSLQHYRAFAEKAAGPLVKLVEALSASDPVALESFRRDFEAAAAEYYSENAMRQEFLSTRAIKN
ncbi:MAG TPA: class I SAM-dependent methyltransferase [Candidatus Acidoferrales bacterium]|nr:class I SAM-dependent methyltransferase [Candidatus Acidoferrales bacterium]